MPPRSTVIGGLLKVDKVRVEIVVDHDWPAGCRVAIFADEIDVLSLSLSSAEKLASGIQAALAAWERPHIYKDPPMPSTGEPS